MNTRTPATGRLARRTFLRNAGVAMALPLLDAMGPRLGSATAAEAENNNVRRMLAICAPLGLHTPNLFPEQSGREYKPTRYLEPLQKLRNKFTVISGMLHPDVDGGHPAEASFLTGAPHPGQRSFKNTISIDQLAAERIGHRTRVPSLSLALDYGGISYTRSGVKVPAEGKPSRLFAQLFLEGSEEDKRRQLKRIQDGQSIMDLVLDQTKSVERAVGRQGHETLDQYFSSVRELEQRLVQAEYWARQPKPKVDRKPPTDIESRADMVGRMRLMYDMIFLAIQTDSTRLITFSGSGGNDVVSLSGVDEGWHNLSHHGKDPAKIEQLAIIELAEMKLFAELMEKLDSAREGDHTLLGQTAIVMGSNLGNASSHSNTNLPIIAAGGHFRHGQHLAFDPAKPPPMCNLLVNVLQHVGVEVDAFSSGTGTLTGLEPA